MKLSQLLEQKEAEIISQAAEALTRAHLPHYHEIGRERNEIQLKTLYDYMTHCVEHRNLTAMVAYAEELAQKRFTAGFDLLEVQTAFNVLEEAIWREIITECSPPDLTEALGLISTIHGAGKDALARQYVSLASRIKPAALNLQALYKGTDGL